MSYGPPPGTPAPAKPGQVTALQVLLWIQFGFALCIGIAGFAIGGTAAAVGGADADVAKASGLLIVVSILAIVLALAAGYVAFSVPKRKTWVRNAVLGIAGIGLLMQILSIVSGGGAPGFIGLAFPIVLIVLAVGQPAKDWFTEQ